MMGYACGKLITSKSSHLHILYDRHCWGEKSHIWYLELLILNFWKVLIRSYVYVQLFIDNIHES